MSLTHVLVDSVIRGGSPHNHGSSYGYGYGYGNSGHHDVDHGAYGNGYGNGNGYYGSNDYGRGHYGNSGYYSNPPYGNANGYYRNGSVRYQRGSSGRRHAKHDRHDCRKHGQCGH